MNMEARLVELAQIPADVTGAFRQLVDAGFNRHRIAEE
jgi:hypothetical protein